MAFSGGGFPSLGNNPQAAAASAGAGEVVQGPELELIQTEGLGFHSLANDAKVRLTSQWSPPPAPTASLLSIASRKGLVAAAGPDAVIIASTESVRKAFGNPQEGDSEIRSFEPQLRIPFPIRICQLAFTADENYLILSAEQGGGLAVYDVQSLLQGSTQTAFEIPTNGESLRALAPNPSVEKAELCAVVTNEGKLLMANMKARDFAPGRNGQILRDQVSCVAWSNKGKQLVAGLGDGTVVQMTPESDVKAEIPRPPELNASYFVEFLAWLENDLLMAVHVSTAETPPDSKWHLITRQGKNFQFQLLPHPAQPFGNDNTPHHAAARLKDFPPDLQDLLIVSSTVCSDIGLISRSKKPLVSDMPAEKVTNVFTTTELADDSRRAALPMNENNMMDSTVAIGVALDLSAKEKVYKPIPTHEMDASPSPLPGYWVLNDEGVLAAWWVVYSESLKSGTTYPGLAIVEGNAPKPAAPQPAQQNAFSSPTASAFGSAAPSTKPAFGGPSALGSRSSPWAAAGASGGTGGMGGMGGAAFGSSTFGTAAASSAPAFGKPSTPAFGQSGGLGMKASPWAAASASGQSPFASLGSGSGSTNAFASQSPTNASSGGGFASFANKGGFSQIGSGADSSSGSTNVFASTPKPEATDVSMNAESTTAFPPPSSKTGTQSGGPFGGQPFKLQSTFQRDPNAGDDVASSEEQASSAGGSSMFGSNFKSMLGETTTQAEKPSPFASAAKSSPFAAAEKPNPFANAGKPSPFASTEKPNPFASSKPNPFGAATGSVQPSSPTRVESTTPTSTPAPNKFLSQTNTAPKSGLFDLPSKISTTPGSSFASAHTPTEDVPGTKAQPEKQRDDIPEAPLPPESTSKATFPFGDSSSSSASSADHTENTLSDAKGAPLPLDSPPAAVDDAPLPPDPSKNKKIYDVKHPPLPGATATATAKPAGDAPLPPDPIRNKKAYDVSLPPLPGMGAKPKPADDAPLPPDPVKQSNEYNVKFPSLPGGGGKTSSSSVLPSPKRANEPFVFPSNPPPASSDSDDDDLSEEGTENESEGSGVDVAKDLNLSPSITGENKTPGFTPTSSFDGMGSFSTISRPDQERRGLFGEIGRNAPMFAQPNVVSPRSPSPVRNTAPSKLLPKDQPRSFSTPAMASQLLGASRRQPGVSPLAVKVTGVENHIIEQQRRAKAKKQAEEAQLLIDEEDDAIQRLLQSPHEPTLTLDEFIAHTGTAAPAGDSIPAQVEAVYRDINSMIDTLGLNARSLTCFIKGHKQFGHERVTKNDLVSPDDWTLDEIEGLTYIIKRDLSDALRAAQVDDVAEKLARCAELQRELARDRNKQADLKKIIDARLDPDQAVANRALPLSAEQAAQQNDLRRNFARFTKALAEAEEDLTLLKAKLVSAGVGPGGKGGGGGPAPTIEAVVRTITKMTSMVEKRSGDIDVLENQMRKLRLGSAAASSRESSPFAASTTTTPATPKNRKGLGASTTSMFSPDRSTMTTPHRSSVFRQSTTGAAHGRSLSSSVFSPGGGGTPRKKLSGFGDVERAAVREKRARRAEVLGRLKSSLEKKGVSVWAVDEGGV